MLNRAIYNEAHREHQQLPGIFGDLRSTGNSSIAICRMSQEAPPGKHGFNEVLPLAAPQSHIEPMILVAVIRFYLIWSLRIARNPSSYKETHVFS